MLYFESCTTFGSRNAISFGPTVIGLYSQVLLAESSPDGYLLPEVPLLSFEVRPPDLSTIELPFEMTELLDYATFAGAEAVTLDPALTEAAYELATPETLLATEFRFAPAVLEVAPLLKVFLLIDTASFSEAVSAGYVWPAYAQ
jgi:hypothetical protein